jgi:hypothetical protein
MKYYKIYGLIDSQLIELNLYDMDDHLIPNYFSEYGKAAESRERTKRLNRIISPESNSFEEFLEVKAPLTIIELYNIIEPE